MFTQIGYWICVPFAALTRLFYSWTGSYGVALLLFTLVVKLVMLPFQLKSKKSMLRMNRMTPRMKEIQAKYANNKERQNQEISKLYMEEGVNPMGGCLWSFIPFPILIALYYIIRSPLRYFMMLSVDKVTEVTNMAVGMGLDLSSANAAYQQINVAQFVSQHFAEFSAKFDGLINLDYNFLGINLANIPNQFFGQFPGGGWAIWGLMILPILSAGLNVVMTMVTMKTQSAAADQKSSKMMLYMMPLMTLWMGYILPAALCIYWIAQSLFSIIQELALNKHYNKILDMEESDKNRAKREARIKKMEQARNNYEQQKSSLKESNKKPQKQKQDSDRKAKTNENGRVGQRPYARGRAFSDDHYKD